MKNYCVTTQDHSLPKLHLCFINTKNIRSLVLVFCNTFLHKLYAIQWSSNSQSPWKWFSYFLWKQPCLGWWLGEAGHPDTIICIAYQQKQDILLIIQKTQKNISLFYIHTFRTPLAQVNFILAVLTDLVQPGLFYKHRCNEFTHSVIHPL